MRAFAIYVLLLLLVAYLLNQLDRYMLAVVSRPMAQDIHYGDKGCLKNDSIAKEAFPPNACNATEELECTSAKANATSICIWDYTGSGQQYQLLAGPVFILIYTFMGIPVSFAADLYNRKNFLAVALVFWSTATLCMGFVQNYWQLALLRFLQGLGESGCTAFAASIIADYFDERWRASAFGVYNWGIYIGYSLAFALGNFVEQILTWRWTFFISGLPGFVFGPLIFFTVKEPQRLLREGRQQADRETAMALEGKLSVFGLCQRLKVILRPFLQPTLFMLIMAGAIRNGAGYVWAYNTQLYFEAIGQTQDEIGRYMSWVPLVGGCIGVVVGGFISDKVINRVGPYARLMVLVVSQVVASPFVAGALYLSPPYAYFSLFPGYIFGEMWVSITIAIALELVPAAIRTSAVAVYLFVITNIGGNMPLLVPPLKRAFMKTGKDSVASLRAALYVLYPGMYLLGALLFLLTMSCLWRDLRKSRRSAADEGQPLLRESQEDDPLLGSNRS